jgi:hypothetical protein
MASPPSRPERPVPAIVAYRPEKPASNPSRATSMNPALQGRVVRLEFPEELDDTDWDGPVYAVLESERMYLRSVDRSPFVRDGEDSRVPAWQCKIVSLPRDCDEAQLTAAQSAYLHEPVWIPFWRLTQPHRNLIGELNERPLLSVFRFARISRYFLASPGGDTKLILQAPGVYVCCQVLAHRPAAAMSLVDDIDVIIEPGSAFVCVVALRRHSSDDPVIAVVPLPEIQANTIPAVEFMLGYGHGLAVPTIQPPPALTPFATGWAHYKSVTASDPIRTRAQLVASFHAADPVTGATIDTGTAPVSFVSPPGAVTSQVPADFVLQLTRRTGTADVGSDSGSDPPLREPLQGPLL